MPEDSKNRELARQAYASGNVAEAVRRQQVWIDATADAPRRQEHLLRILYLSTQGDYRAVVEAARQSLVVWPGDAQFEESLGAALIHCGHNAEAVAVLESLSKRHDDRANIHDGLAHAYGELGEYEQARAHGERALTLKDAACRTPAGVDLLERPIPAYDASAPERNVIAFSLWGGNFRYLDTAVRNAEVARTLYPGWRCRFYCDASVPDFIRGQLLAAGADVVLMPAQGRLFEGLFWRFLPASETGIDRFLVRDADSLISLREREAVMEWLDSGKAFHVMRDDFAHTDPILAGMWGGVAGILPPLEPLWQPWLDSERQGPNCDQRFLREVVWPLIRTNVLIHDRRYRVFGARPFPAHAPDTDGHVGENHVLRREPSFGHLSGGDVRQRRRYVFTITTGRSGTACLARLLDQNLSHAEVHHERGENFHSHGWHTPDASHFMRFNSIGNLPDVREFWRRKFGAILYGQADTYCEVSHFLAKGGLIENLDLLGGDAEIHIIHLTRDLFETAWSLANRFDFYNLGFTWLFYLDPRYPRNLVPAEAFGRHGMLGYALWYVHEIRARAAYYQRRLEGLERLHFHRIDLAELKTGEGPRRLLQALEPGFSELEIQIPDQTNATTQWHLGDREQQILQGLVTGARVDYASIVTAAVRERRLGEIPLVDRRAGLVEGDDAGVAMDLVG